MDEKLALLIGLILSDGSIYYDKSKKSYCIQFTNKNTELLNLFRNLMRECFGIVNISEHKCKNAKSLRAFSTKYAKDLFSYSPSFRTQACEHKPICADPKCLSEHTPINGIRYPSCKVPDEILEEKQLAAAFLKGFASGDGTLYINRNHSIFYVAITCYHPSLRNQIAKCINSLEIPTRFNKEKILVSGFRNCKKFLNTVGFIPERTLVLGNVSHS